MKILIKLRTLLMKWKQYISRTVTYLSIINSGMILLLFLSKVKELGYINADLDKYFFAIFGIGVFSLIFLGWIDIKFIKGMQEENRIVFTLSPYHVQLRKDIDYIMEKLNEKKT